MKETLRNIAQMFSGIYLKPDFEGDVFYIQAKHFNENREFDFSIKPELNSDPDIERHFLRPGDILLAGKGSNNFAVHYKGIVKKAIASSTFIVIRIFDQKKILPEYLCWYFNHPQTQLYFKDKSRGTDILSLTIKVIREMDVFFPSVDKQKVILEIDLLAKRQKELMHKIESKRENQLNQQLLQSIKN